MKIRRASEAVFFDTRSSISKPFPHIVAYWWKVPNVTPISKNDESNTPKNYRKIAIASTLSKAMKNIINHLVIYLQSNNLISHRSLIGSGLAY